ncbi:hypothetical protein Syun_003645 [Stephania yunnanensis]|uniref:Transmembrane protein n=1 Tax=Stephania yunnanensis TaxID=152371 RepID=A0AAP0Q0E7_9MAGN
MGLEVSQAQAFTFLVRDQRLGANMGSVPTCLGKYLMHSPTGEIIFGGENMHFWDLRAPWLEPLSGPNGLNLSRLKNDIQPWQERRSTEYMTHAPLSSLNYVGSVATEIDEVNYVSPKSWLVASHFVLGFFLFVGHLWHAGRACAAVTGFEKGIDRNLEPNSTAGPEERGIYVTDVRDTALQRSSPLSHLLAHHIAKSPSSRSPSKKKSSMRSEGDHRDSLKSFAIRRALFNILVGLKPRSFSLGFPVVGKIQPYFRWHPSIDEAIVRATYDSKACVRYGALMRELCALGVSPKFVTNEAWNRHREFWAFVDFKEKFEKASQNRKNEKGGPSTGPSKHTGVTRYFQTYENALDRDEDDEITPNDVFFHVHTKDRDGVTFIYNRSTRFHPELVRRHKEHT